MFNEKNISRVLDHLSTLFDSINKSEYSSGINNHDFPVIGHTNDEIAQALMANIQTVYQFCYSSPRLQYAAQDLFGKRACLLTDRLIAYDDSDDFAEVTEGSLDLWLLEDLQVAVVEYFRYEHETGDGFTRVEHRRIRCMVEDVNDLEFNPLEYYHQLDCIYQDWDRSGRKICRF